MVSLSLGGPRHTWLMQLDQHHTCYLMHVYVPGVFHWLQLKIHICQNNNNESTSAKFTSQNPRKRCIPSIGKVLLTFRQMAYLVGWHRQTDTHTHTHTNRLPQTLWLTINSSNKRFHLFNSLLPTFTKPHIDYHLPNSYKQQALTNSEHVYFTLTEVPVS